MLTFSRRQTMLRISHRLATPLACSGHHSGFEENVKQYCLMYPFAHAFEAMLFQITALHDI
jgi:hypothetical protein